MIFSISQSACQIEFRMEQPLYSMRNSICLRNVRHSVCSICSLDLAEWLSCFILFIFASNSLQRTLIAWRTISFSLSSRNRTYSQSDPGLYLCVAHIQFLFCGLPFIRRFPQQLHTNKDLNGLGWADALDFFVDFITVRPDRKVREI